MWALDHLAVSCGRLDEGVQAVESALGAALAGGGQHPHMATHNRLLSLGPDLYLEVIAADPTQPRPAWPRWFDLDRFTGTPRLTNWICRCDDLDAALADAPRGTGTAVALSRGDFRWRMAVPDTGVLPFDDAFPALIRWEGSVHPAHRLPDHGIRLARLDVTHPQADLLAATLAPHLSDGRIGFAVGPKAMQATFATPWGERSLS